MQLVLKTRDEAEAVRQANETAKRKHGYDAARRAVAAGRRRSSRRRRARRFSGDAVEVSFTVRSPSGLPIDGVEALIDGRPVEARGLAPAASQTAGSSEETRHLTIPAPPHDFELALIARAGDLVGEAAKVRLVYAGAAPADAASLLKPKLYAVTIGVSDYADPDAAARLRRRRRAGLRRGAANARRAGSIATSRSGRWSTATRRRANVVEALEWLERQVTSRDVGMVLIAGHGVTDEKGRYWFLPADAVRSSSARPRSRRTTSGAT